MTKVDPIVEIIITFFLEVFFLIHKAKIRWMIPIINNIPPITSSGNIFIGP